MNLLVQRAYVVASGQALQTSRHSVQMRLDSVSFKPCVICFRCVQNLVSGSDVLHSFLNVQWHFPNDTPMLIKGHARAALEGFGNLLLHLYYMPTFGPVFPKAPGAEFAQIAFY